jgi:hypothetical protein
MTGWKRALGVGLAIALASAAAGFAAQVWTPARADVARLERTIVLPAKAERLEAYARYYTGEIIQGHKLIRGDYLSGGPPFAAKPGVYFRKGSAVADGGCSVITVYYDPAIHSFASIECNGYG